MMRRLLMFGPAALALLLVPATADAQIMRVSSDTRSAIGVTVGFFGLRGEDARHEDDVLLANREALAFDIGDFNTGTIGAEWLIGLSEYLEAGIGVGYQRRTVPSVYLDFTHDDGFEIEQDLKLRVVPVTGTVRFLPTGRRGPVQPYVGGGIGFFNWRYSEVGEFVDFRDESIFRARYVANGNAVGPVLLAGLRAPVADIWLIGGELRWQRAEGNTKAAATGLLGDKIDLGGWSANLAVHFRF
jgi:outer membrane protein W